jgi:hypothetical protein
MIKIPGVAENLKGVTERDNLTRILLNQGGGFDRHGIYTRDGVTCELPCKSHLYWAQKGFTLLELLAA